MILAIFKSAGWHSDTSDWLKMEIIFEAISGALSHTAVLDGSMQNRSPSTPTAVTVKSGIGRKEEQPLSEI